MVKHGLSPKERLIMNRTINETGCWLWTASCDQNGYGRLKIDSRVLRAHRVAYEVFVRPLEDGEIVLHNCDVPACINPEHLRAGSHKDNAIDREQKGRGAIQKKTRCKHGHEFGETNYYLQQNDRGYVTKYCRICKLARDARNLNG